MDGDVKRPWLETLKNGILAEMDQASSAAFYPFVYYDVKRDIFSLGYCAGSSKRQCQIIYIYIPGHISTQTDSGVSCVPYEIIPQDTFWGTFF